MAKSFVCRRSPDGMAVMTDTIDHVRRDVHEAEKLHGGESLETAGRLLILASLYYVVEDYERAEPLLVRYVDIVKEKHGPTARETFCALWLLSDAYIGLNRFPDAIQVSEEAKSISRAIDCSTIDSLINTLMRRAEAYKGKSDLPSRQRGLLIALIALSWCMTSGFHKSSAGVQALERLRFFLNPYAIGKEDWGWIVKHAHLTKYDFVGLLSILLPHTGLAPRPLSVVARRTHRVIEVR